GDAASAGRIAAWLAVDQLDFRGALSVASGWLDRARRLLQPLPPGPEHGWFAFHEGFIASVRGDSDTAEKLGLRAAELGRVFCVPDLEMLGLALQGAILVSRARVRDGMQCLDEAAAIALAGEATIPISGAWTCCFLVTACAGVLDYERAFEWCDRIEEFSQRYGNRYMLGFCRDHYATIHLWRGDWSQAERALDESIDALLASRPPSVASPLTQLAELRRRQGRDDECEQLLERAGGSQRAQLCRANLALDRGDPLRAADLAERVLRAVDPARPIDQVPALEVLVRAQVACGRLDDAGSTVQALEEIAQRVGTVALRALAAFSGGLLAAASGESTMAKSLLEAAIDGFDRCGAAFDGARARIELAQTLAVLGRADDARREAAAALRRLQDLGALSETKRAERILRAGTVGSGPPAPVSPRETQVLSLIAAGLTNREISERLFISEHTVHRHVTNILRKLELPSRAAAAAYAVRAGLGQRS
ncbi:MAG TPA: LuxR C-terminal-related transcriptional regulator, partial [Burkholderiaceae bacterium]|nr:LuxR C-terminal-related transcriptional regulator [Burkholderiaceae bacterium]